MAKKKSKYRLMKVGLYAFWGILGVLALIIIAAYGADIIGVEASVGDSPTAGFSGIICRTYKYAGFIVGGLAVLMVSIAGIVYATSQGEGSGETGIGLAKSMITAAITGVLLYMIGLWLIGGPCTTGKGLVDDILDKAGVDRGASESNFDWSTLFPNWK